MPAPSSTPTPTSTAGKRRSLALLTALAALAAVTCAVVAGVVPLPSLETERLQSEIAALGPWGPAMIVTLMMVAVIFSPLPSAPVAVVSGALYGHGWGSLYVLIGAQLGAMACFAISRALGYDALHRWFGDRLNVGLLGSQRALTYGILVSRLLPFLSFDLVSYAAGLTVIRFWRFAAATLVGTAPSSFLLAHVGSEAATGEISRIGLTVLLLGLVTAFPLIAARLLNQRQRRGTLDKPREPTDL